MLRMLLLGFVGVAAAASQVAFNRGGEDWNLNELPNPDSTGHLLFNSLSSLLQQWPNARYRNGHSYIPGTVPTGTLLYHGRANSSIPSVPQWVATDPEHSLIFCRTWHLTFSTTRPLNVLYLDGSSAAKTSDGSLDTQDMLLWGHVPERPQGYEGERIVGLCEWGKEFGLDGFVRMEMDFEIMLCDFTQGVKLVSSLELSTCEPWPQPHHPRPPQPPPGEQSPNHQTSTYSQVPPLVHSARPTFPTSIMIAGASHNSFPGETRIKLAPHQLVTFLDTTLAPSLMDMRRLAPTKWEYRAGNASTQDAERVKTALEQVLRDRKPGSGVDWISLSRVIIHRYAERLELLRYTLGEKKDATVETIKEHVNVLLSPYTVIGVSEKEVFKLCATSHTGHISSDVEGMTATEHLILNAVRETENEICRVLVKIWVYIDKAKFEDWHSDIRGLMDWLDWSVWVKCNPICTFDEMCYLPTWPFRQGDNRGYHPQPRCIRRLPPYDF